MSESETKYYAGSLIGGFGPIPIPKPELQGVDEEDGTVTIGPHKFAQMVEKGTASFHKLAQREAKNHE